MSDEKKGDTEPKKTFPLQNIRGLPFPKFLRKNIEEAIDFKPSDTDIFVVTYPKCGTTWTQFIVWEIMHKGAVPPSPNQMVYRDFCFLEYTGTAILKKLPPPRTMKTHLPFHLQPYNSKAKYIYVARNPWDCCVSYYYQKKFQSHRQEVTFDDHFESFIKGEVGWGDFFDHVQSWFEHRNDPNVLFLTYEDIKKDTRKAMLTIAEFLGDSFYKDLQDEEVLQNCMKHTDFKYMKELPFYFLKQSLSDLTAQDAKNMIQKLGEMNPVTPNIDEFMEVNFFRKGEVGDWKRHFSPMHVKKFNEYMLKKLKNTEMENFWQPLWEKN